jgi:hypothetical protein
VICREIKLYWLARTVKDVITILIKIKENIRKGLNTKNTVLSVVNTHYTRKPGNGCGD